MTQNNKVKTPWYKHYNGINPFLEYPDLTLYELIETKAKNRLNYCSYNYFGNKKTYGEFLKQIHTCARAFKALNVNAGDVISICMPNTPEAIIAFYAINKIGAIANMIHPLSSEKEIEHFVVSTNSKYIITIDIAYKKVKNLLPNTMLQKIIFVSPANSMPLHLKTAYRLTQIGKKRIRKDENTMVWNDFIRLSKNYKGDFNYHFDKDKVAAILYSGGTTGYPKGIELTNMNFNALALQSFEACHCLNQKDRVLAAMPVFHGFGLGICIHTVQYFGGTSILLPRLNAKEFGKLILNHKPNIIAGVPTLYEALLKAKELEGKDLSFIKCALSGGDALPPSLKKRMDNFLQEHGADIQIREGYGLTECVTGSCLTPEKEYREGSIGIPYPDTYYKIVEADTDKELKYGTEGEIVLSGPSVMKGYYKNDKETAKALKKHKDGLNWLHTGDVGYMDEEGFIYFKQRIKRMIVSSGYSIYPQYIENVIDTHEDVDTSCVIGVSHPYKMEVPKAYIVLKEGVEPSEKVRNSIKKHTQKLLARFSWPSEYEFIDELPKTLVGKIDFKKLTEMSKRK